MDLANCGDESRTIPFESLASGEFVVDGLPPEWSGSLTIGRGLLLDDGTSTARVEKGQQSILLRAHSRPSIHGRLVTPQQQPLPGAKGLYRVQCSSADSTSGLRTDEDGRFSVPLACGRTSHAYITLAVPEGWRWTTRLEAVPAEGLDLGDVFPEPCLDVPFACIDDGGNPIEGACARLASQVSVQSEPTDELGQGTFRELPLADARLVFTALGHAERVVTISPLAPGDLPRTLVVLERLPCLKLRVVEMDGRPAREVEVQLACSDPTPFLGRDGRQADPVQQELGAASPSRRSATVEQGQARAVLTYHPDSQGRIWIPGFIPRNGADVSVLDRSGSILRSFHLSEDRLEAREDLEVQLSTLARRLRVLVSDTEGEPVDRAIVQGATTGFSFGRTDIRGELVIFPLYGDSVDVLIGKSGFSTSFVDGILLSDVESVHRVRLEPGRTLRLDARTASGQEIEVQNAWVRVGETVVGRGPEDVRKRPIVIEDLPAGVVSCLIRAGGRLFQREQDTSIPDLHFVVPEAGSVVVRPRYPDQDHLEVSVDLRSIEDPSVELQQEMPDEPTAGDVRFPTVFPGSYRLLVKTRSRTQVDFTSILDRVIEVRANAVTMVERGS